MHVKLDQKSNDNKINESYKYLQENSLLLNYAEWCSHCNDFKEDWNKIVRTLTKYKKGPNVVQIEHSAHEKMKSSNKKMFNHVTKKEGKNRVLYYPMIIAFKKTGDKIKKIVYEGERTSGKVIEFVKEHFKPVESSSPQKKKTIPKKKKRVVKKIQKGGAALDDDLVKDRSVQKFVQQMVDNLFGI